MLTVWDTASPASPRPPGSESPSSAREPLLSAGPTPRRRAEDFPAVLSDTVEVSGRPVEVFSDECFSKLRQLHGISDSFLNSDKENSVDFGNARSESKLGKGGEAQYEPRDARFVIKSISGDDHLSLLMRAESYVERQLGGECLIVPIYLHFRLPSTKKTYIAMRNLTPDKSSWSAKYDLKGCADDKTLMLDGNMVEPIHKRFYRVDMWCSCTWTEKRWQYYDGKVRARALQLQFPPQQRDEIVRLIEGDADWLVEQGLMDYSLFVAIRRMPANQLEAAEATNGNHAAQPVRQYTMIEGAEAVLVTIGIIDFLQPWTAAKKVARCIKSLEFNKATIPPPAYGARFKRHFAERFKGDERLASVSPKAAV